MKDFEDFPEEVKRQIVRILRIAANGETAEKVKPFRGFGSGVFEAALRHKGDAFRLIYDVQIEADIWVIHAFQKKSKTGIKTPKMEADLVRKRIKRLKEQWQ